jgi:cell division septation protein DedD
MGPNSFRNLTYAAVLLVVSSLVYLIYKSSKNKNKLNPAMEAAAASGLSTYGDTSATLAGATLTPDLSTTSQDGQLVSGAAASSPASSTSPSTYNSKSKSSDEVKEITAEEPGSLSSAVPSDAIASSEKKVNVKSGGNGGTPEKMSIASKGVKAKAKFDAGNTKGDFMVVAGAFASKDNAAALVSKMKSMGFAKAEAVKMENSANTYAIAGYYEFKGGAEAAVRTLKTNKVESLVKKRSGEIYHAAPAPVVAPKSPVKPAAKTAQATKMPI